MKNFNWLIKLIFYKHKEKEAKLPQDSTGIFYSVGFVDQMHANLCTNASESMIKHFFGKPFATMATNPRGFMHGASPDSSDYQNACISPDEIQLTLKQVGPFIMSLPLKYGMSHSVVVTGCTKDNVIYNDPLTGSHKMISITTLKELCQEDEALVQIAKPLFTNTSCLVSRVTTNLPVAPPNIVPKNYQKFFGLDKMYSPCDAVLNFLEDYSRFSLWSLGRHHKKEVEHFVARNRGKELTEILSDLDKTFPKDAINNKGELFKRILTIEKIINTMPTDELDVSKQTRLC